MGIGCGRCLGHRTQTQLLIHPDSAPAHGDALSRRRCEEWGNLPWDIKLDKGAALPAEDGVEISSDNTNENIAPAPRACHKTTARGLTQLELLVVLGVERGITC